VSSLLKEPTPVPLLHQRWDATDLDEDEEYSYFLWEPTRLLMEGVAELVSCDDVGGYVERFLAVLESTAPHPQ